MFNFSIHFLCKWKRFFCKKFCGYLPITKEVLISPVSKLILLATLLTGFSSANSDELFPEITPSPAYTAEEVVGIQMRALGHNDKPYKDAGIQLTFRFASPNNQKSTGPLERFMALFDSPAYRPMINHIELEIGDSSVSNEYTFVPVIVTDSNSIQAGYLFALSKQSQPPYENCWMTDSVAPIKTPNNETSI